MPKLVRLFVINYVIGFGVSAVFVAILLGLNVANMRTLIFNSDMALLATFLLWFFNGIVFAGVQVGIAIMKQAD